MNDQIKKLHQSLGNTVQALSQRLGRTADPDDAEAILREMEEVNFRVMMAGRLLFRRTTARIDQSIDDVVTAKFEMDSAIEQIEKTKDLVKSVGKFLTKVDKVLDAVKVLAV